MPPESQVKTWKEEIIPYNKPTIKERQPLSWTSGKTGLQERRLGISVGCRAEGFTTLETGWQCWKGPYLHRISLQTSKGAWAGSKGQSGILFTVSDFSDEWQYPPSAREPEGIWAEGVISFQIWDQLATHQKRKRRSKRTRKREKGKGGQKEVKEKVKEAESPHQSKNNSGT